MTNGESENITLTEWLNYVRLDTEMKLESSAEDVKNDLKYESEGLTVWEIYSKNGIEDNYAWFDLRRGNIIVKNPDQEIINKMIDIAVLLNAKVQGDDGEIYASKTKLKEKKPWWKIWN